MIRTVLGFLLTGSVCLATCVTILDEDETNFYRFYNLVMLGARAGNRTEIKDAVHEISSNDTTNVWVHSPNWTTRVKSLLDYCLDNKLCYQPSFTDVANAYKRFIGRTALPACQAVSDASVYFLERNAHDLVHEFDIYATRLKCEDKFYSWNRVKVDERFK